LTILQAVLLGLLQGLTEFLPISSSGHLVLAEHFLGVAPSADVTFEIFVHFGTLMSVVVVLWKEIKVVVLEVLSTAADPRNFRGRYKEREELRLAIYLFVASIPAAIVGLRFEDSISAAFQDPKLVSVMLIFTGLFLYLTRIARPREGKHFSLWSSILVGCAQALAIIPGLSRSGLTISTAMYVRISPDRAARFSFLLALPVIAGGTILHVKDLLVEGVGAEGLLTVALGTATAFVSGFLAIRFLLRLVEKGKFSVFSIYCLIAGTLGVFFIG
jgi:undecaprenyl-diphosphatase